MSNFQCTCLGLGEHYDQDFDKSGVSARALLKQTELRSRAHQWVTTSSRLPIIRGQRKQEAKEQGQEKEH